MDYYALGENLIKQARKKGAHEAEIFISEKLKNTIKVHHEEVESVKSSREKGLGIRIFIDKKLGFGYSSDFSDPHLSSLLDKIINLAQEIDSDPGNILPENLPSDNNFDIFDNELSQIPLEEKINKLKEAEKLGYNDKRIINTEFALYDEVEESNFLINSRGICKSYRATEAGMVFIMIASDGSVSETGMDFTLNRFYKKLDPYTAVSNASREAIMLLGGRKIKSQKLTAVFSPNAGSEFVSIIASALSAEACQKGRSFLKNCSGKQIANSKVNIIDDGTLKGGLLTVPMDGEGVPTQRNILIQNGILKKYLYNTYTANKEGISSTGNGFRSSYKSTPAIIPSNFYLEQGNIKEHEMIKKIDKGIYIKHTMNVGGINPITGEYSVGINGIWIENGELTYPVREVTIASTLPDMLNNIIEVADNILFIPVGYTSICGSPGFQISEITLGGI
ncbi:TldD/PmbA family protein [Candidatus Desantisbacteria bacterium]|nr:TldD/PmbA family protein [Candidatus Desantisbacteria bacterium]